MWDLTKIGEDFKISEDQFRTDDYHNFVWKLIMCARDTEHSDFSKDDLQLFNSFLLQNRMYFNCVDKNNDINLLKEEIAEFRSTVKEQDEILKTELLREITELKETVCRQNNAINQVELLRKEIDILKSALEKNECKTNELTVLADKIEIKSAAQHEQEMLKNSMEETKLAMKNETEVFRQEIEVIKSNMQQEKEMLQMQVDEIKSQVQESMLTKDYVKQKSEQITDQVDDVKKQIECLTVKQQEICRDLSEESLAGKVNRIFKEKEYELNELTTEIQKLNNATNDINKEMETMKKDVEELVKDMKQPEEFMTEITAKVSATETLIRSLEEKYTTLKDELEEYFDNEFSRVMKLAPVIPGLDIVVLEACDTENWEKCKKYLRQNLPENCAAYQQLVKVKDNNVLLCAVKYDYEELVAVILKNGFPINNPVVKERCRTLCHIAAQFGSKKILKFLITWHVDIEARDNSGYTPLHFAAQWGHVDVVNLLLQKGALINVKTDFNNTPLHFASLFRHISIIQLLNLHSCDKKVKNNYGNNAYDFFIQDSRSYIEHLLKPV